MIWSACLMSIELEVVLDEDDRYISTVWELMLLFYWWFSIICWFLMGKIVPTLWVVRLSTLSGVLEFCCYDFFILSLSIINYRLIPLMVVIYWYELLLCMGISFLEDWEHIVELCLFLWCMGWNNISGWEFCIGDWKEQSLDVKEEELLNSLEWEEADEHEWFVWCGALFGGIMIDDFCRRL